MTYEQFYAILSSVVPNVSRDDGEGETCPYIVYSAQAARATWANNRPAVKVTPAKVEYFTRDRYDGNPELIETAFADNGIPYEPDDIETDKETGITTFTWTCEVVLH